MKSNGLFTVLSLILAASHVTSFSISRRHERSTDLADALAILQKQRRGRVGGGDYMGSDLDARTLTLEDVSDWLSKPRGHGPRDDRFLEPAWVSDGDFKDFDPRLSYSNLLETSAVLPQSVKPTKQELNDIFSTDDPDSNSSRLENISDQPEKKKKEEMVELKGDKKVIQKKSVGTEMTDALVAVAEKAKEDMEDDLSLESLTKEEFQTLMKAVGKLQKQALRLSEKKLNSPEAEKVTVIETVEKEGPEKAVAVVQPVSDEELKTVFEETVQPVVKETDILVEGPEGAKTERIVEEAMIPAGDAAGSKAMKEAEKELSTAIASQLESELDEASKDLQADREVEDEILANNLDALEHYWLVNKYVKNLDEKPAPMKRTTKRSTNAVSRDLKFTSGPPEDDFDDFQVAANPPPISSFVARIVELQSEVDKLKMVARLEDLENDVLTDALNEATLAQKEGSVTDTEFDSLQQAIRIEEALQDLKNSEDKKHTGSVAKRGEPWKRRIVASVEADIPELSGSRFNKNDMDRLLSELEDDQSQDFSPEVASLFLDHAEECPAVQSYSTNCELADLYSLPVDNEARSLCNIHEMCYACGFSLGVTQDHCDFVYRAAATALCQSKENCVLESEIFLRTMKLKTRYIPHTQPDCRSTCASKFLGMI